MSEIYSVKEQIAALVAEREHYRRYPEKYKDSDREKAVDAELERLGSKGKPPVQRATRMVKPQGEAV